MSIHDVLADFAASEVPGAIVLQGRWGIGKTYFWRHKVLPLVFKRPGKKRHSYVSLFGINSLGELKTALAVATEEAEQQAKHDEQWFRRARRMLNSSQPLTSDAVSFIPTIGTELARFVEKLGYLMIRDRIICFDDIERRGDGLALKDFMGLVSYLVDQRRCRIVVILNTGELGDQQVAWDRMREKVFDGEFTYMPSIQETIDLGLSDSANEPWAKTLRESLLKLSISNIRLVHRTVKFMKRALEVRGIGKLSAGTMEHMAKALPMLVYSVHGQGEGGPPIDDVMNRRSFNPSAVGKPITLSKHEEHWRSIVAGYGLYLHNSLDKALLGMVQNGYPDPNALCAAIDEIEQNAAHYAAIEAFHEAWNLYRNSFADNCGDILSEFERTWPPVSASQDARNLESVVQLLRFLGRPDVASRFIETWIVERLSQDSRTLSPSEAHMLGKVHDEEILSAVQTARLAAFNLMPIQSAFESIQKSHGNLERAIASFAAASIDNIIEVLDNNPGENMPSAIQTILDLPENSPHTEWAIAAQKMQEACRRIALRSPLNAHRIKSWFGLDPYS